MSNWKRAYGWSGHILTRKSEADSSTEHNVIAIDDAIFDTLEYQFSNLVLDERIRVEVLGVEDNDLGHHLFLACGSPVSFSEGFTFYGTVFKEAELKAEKDPLSHDYDQQYMDAMKELFQLNLPPCRLMIGCSSEH